MARWHRWVQVLGHRWTHVGAPPEGRAGGAPEPVGPLEPLTRRDRIELLMHEYDAISEQIVHWDSQRWQLSQFFVAVEAVSLGIVGQWLLPALQGSSGTVADPALAAGVVSVAGAINLYVCYSWFRTARSNLDYCNTRFKRAREIEDSPLVGKTMQLYHHADDALRDASRRNHASAGWVRHIPSAFILAWIAVLAAAAWIAETRPMTAWTEVAAPLTVLAIAVGVIALTERIGWSASLRNYRYWEP